VTPRFNYLISEFYAPSAAEAFATTILLSPLPAADISAISQKDCSWPKFSDDPAFA